MYAQLFWRHLLKDYHFSIVLAFHFGQKSFDHLCVASISGHSTSRIDFFPLKGPESKYLRLLDSKYSGHMVSVATTQFDYFSMKAAICTICIMGMTVFRKT